MKYIYKDMYDAVFTALKEELNVRGASLGNNFKVISDWEHAEVCNSKFVNLT